LEPEREPASPPRISLWPLALLGTALALLSFRKTSKPNSNTGKSAPTDCGASPESGLSPSSRSIGAENGISPTAHTITYKCEHETPPWKKKLEYAAVVVALGLLLINIFLWCATKKSADTAHDALAIGERAYVTIGRPDGTVADIVWPEEGTGNAGLIVYFQNNGRVPAKFNWGADSNLIDSVPTDLKAAGKDQWNPPFTELPTNHLFQPMYRAKNRKGNDIQSLGTIDIAGGSSYQGLLWEVPAERMHQLINLDRMFLPSGKFEYCDGFGRRVCKNFHLQYFRQPLNRFLLLQEGECQAYEMQIAHPFPDYDYSPPCDTSEREELKVTIPSLPKP
jgi:hypothetical protein